jgi:hypothetical protein
MVSFDDQREVTTMTPLQTEIAFYDSQKAELLKSHLGKFVVISGEKIIGIFDTSEAAYAAGVSEVGTASLLLRQILPETPVASAPALYTGLVSLNN